MNMLDGGDGADILPASRNCPQIQPWLRIMGRMLQVSTITSAMMSKFSKKIKWLNELPIPAGPRFSIRRYF